MPEITGKNHPQNNKAFEFCRLQIDRTKSLLFKRMSINVKIFLINCFIGEDSPPAATQLWAGHIRKLADYQ
jgi:hypothetical protein